LKNSPLNFFTLLADRRGKAAFVHGLPEVFHHHGEDFRLGGAVLQQCLETVLGQKLHILGEHGEEHAHQEHGHLLGGMAGFLQRLADAGDAGGDLARHLGGMAGGIERDRVGPDGGKPLTDLLVAQVFQIDAEGAPIGKLIVGLPVAAEVGIDLDGVADIADQHEGRRLMGSRQQTDIVFRLSASVHHEHVPSAVCAGTAPARRAFHARQLRHVADFLVAGDAALLGLQHETVALVEIDAPRRGSPLAGRLLHHPLEDIVVALMGGRGGIGLTKAQKAAKLRQEQRVVRTLLSAFLPLPPFDESFDLNLCLFSAHASPLWLSHTSPSHSVTSLILQIRRFENGKFARG
jgi:hypothetical protein